ncbi:MAG: DNA repair protein RecN [Anaerolineae bacterium]|nr:DNA repair protein RecN [Anaerolineae bacterium]
MLKEILIKDFAIIDDLELHFAPGFNVLTGETGAGKSIILDAVSLLLGERVDSDDVRSGEQLALIEGTFELPEGSVREHVEAILTREELQGDTPNMLILTREVKRGGRSVCRVNGHTVSLTLLKEVGEELVDIHGQTEHLSLLKPGSHLNLLDRYGNLYKQRAELTKIVKQVEVVRTELHDLLSNEATLKQRAEMLAYQLEEISAANLKPGEDEELREETKRLANSEQLAELATEAYRALRQPLEETPSASDLLSIAAEALGELVKIDGGAKEIAEMAESLSIQTEELARSLADYQNRVEYDPGRLHEAEMRLEVINQLKRRYNCDTIEELIESAAEAGRQMESIEHSGEHIEELQDQEGILLAEIGRLGAALSGARSEIADTLSKAVEAELADLKMESARFGVSIEQVDDPEGAPVGDYRVGFDETGIDKVEFLIAPNLGEPLKPIARIASGGETSRIMLALKAVLSRADHTPTLIFDEIDSGIGGRIGAIVGQKLWALSNDHQVLVVTHLPQLAGFSDTHLKVEKVIKDNRTVTQVFPLGGVERIEELTAMLGPEAESARQSAQELLVYVEGIKKPSLQR